MRFLAHAVLWAALWATGCAVAQAPAKARPAARKSAPPAYHDEVSAPLAPELVALAEQVHVGQLPCELGQFVILMADEKSPGRFYMHHLRQTYHLTPVMSRTGALRLEDEKQGAVWIQLANKSMLMRLADECQSPVQATVAQAMKLAPPVHLLEGGRDVARK
jgi:hypothetical protein